MYVLSLKYLLCMTKHPVGLKRNILYLSYMQISLTVAQGLYIRISTVLRCADDEEITGIIDMQRIDSVAHSTLPSCKHFNFISVKLAPLEYTIVLYFGCER